MFYEDKTGKIYYEYYPADKAGSNDAKLQNIETLVFIHGNTLDLTMWAKQLEFFKGKFNILLYDMRGFGKSEIPKGEHSRDGDLILLLKHLNICKVTLVGISRGAQVAVDVANIYPEYVSKLIVADPVITSWSSEKPSMTAKFWEETIAIARAEGVNAGKEHWFKAPLFDAVRQNKLVMQSLKPIMENYNGWNWLQDENRIEPRINPMDDLSNIKIPTLIICGELDLEEYHECARFLNSKIAGSEMKIVKGAGHLVNIEEPERFNEVVGDFLVKA